MPKSTVTPQIFILEDLIRKGQIRQAQEILVDITGQSVPPGLILKISSFARRAALPELGMRLILPLIAPGNPKTENHDNYLAEYAANLVRAGAPREALAILKRLNANIIPEVSLFTAFALIGEWRYREAVEPLQNYLSIPGLDPYLLLVAQINLASCFIHEGQFAEAHGVLSPLKAEAEERGYVLLFGLASKMTAQALIESGELTEARKALNVAERALVRAGALDKIFIAKWTAILALKETGPTARNTANLSSLRKLASLERHWETVRDCDRALLYAKPTQALYERLYFGTPYENFRNELINRVGKQFQLPERYEWNLSHKGKRTKKISITENAEDTKSLALKTGETSHRLLLALCSDFYRPFRTASLFGQIFEGEYFNPDSSPVRLRVAMQRLRATLKSARVPLLIETNAGEYRVDPKSNVIIELVAPSAQHGKPDVLFEKLKLAVGSEEFTAKEVAEKFHSSTRTMQRLLEQAVERGQVIRIGGSRNTRYKCKN